MARKSPRIPAAFSFDAFLLTLGPEVKKAPIVESVQSSFALSPAPDLAAFLARHPAPGKKLKRNEFGLWSIGYAPFREKSWARAVTDGPTLSSAWEDIVPALTGTVEIGRDGSGDHYLAEVHPQRSSVFKLEAGTGLLHYLATSFAAFAELNHVMNEFLPCLEDGDLDPDELTKKQIAASPALKALSKQAATLSGKIDLRECTEYEELLAPLVNKHFTARTKSPVVALAKRCHWLKLVLLHGGDLAKAQAKRPAPASKALLAFAPARVQELLEAAVFAPRELDALVERAKSDEAKLVRGLAGAVRVFEDWRKAKKR